MKRVQLAQSFYNALCIMLLQHKPKMGSELYWRLAEIGGVVIVRDARTKIRELDYALFKAPAIDVIQGAWKRKIEQCTTDQELLQTAIVAQKGNSKKWLQTYIKRRISSAIPLDQSRACTLLGFFEGEDGLNLIKKMIEIVPDTWIGELLQTSLRRWQTNFWAKHWFWRFLTVKDDSLSWAAFRLFLHCVDSRFWLWQREMQTKVEESARKERRKLFLKDNSGVIENRIRKNEETLKKRLFGQKIQSNQAWPWM
jgi:hypothetical protein